MSTRFHIKHSPTLESSAVLLREIIDSHLDKKLLLLMSGGSAIKLGAELSKFYTEAEQVRLSWGVIDERFVPLSNQNSNTGQLRRADFLSSAEQLIPPTPDAFESREQAAASYNRELHLQLTACDIAIGVYGLGEDGHTAGMLPMDERPFTDNFSNESYVAEFVADDFERVTTTQTLIPHLHEVVLFANGKSKKSVLNNFINKDEAYHKQPVQSLKLNSKVTIITDQEVEEK